MLPPKCPKCTGKFQYLPDFYDTPSLRCVNCGLLVQKELKVKMNYEHTPVNVAAKDSGSNGGGGGQKRSVNNIDNVDKNVALPADSVFLATKDGKRWHVLKRTDKRGDVAWCGVAGTVKSEEVPDRDTLCGKCLLNWGNHK